MRALRFLAVLLLLSSPALAHQFEAGTLTIHHPWSRATPPGAKVAAGYLEITNAGDTDDRLIAVSSPIATSAEVHDMSMDGGVMKMRPLAEGLVIPAQGGVTLAPGGLHIMFKGLQAPLVEDDSFTATLVFEKAGEVQVRFLVEALDSQGADHDHDTE